MGAYGTVRITRERAIGMILGVLYCEDIPDETLLSILEACVPGSYELECTAAEEGSEAGSEINKDNQVIMMKQFPYLDT